MTNPEESKADVCMMENILYILYSHEIYFERSYVYNTEDNFEYCQNNLDPTRIYARVYHPCPREGVYPGARVGCLYR